MITKTQSKSKPELVISRRFPAPRELVFKAWSSAEHMKRWFSPAAFTVPDAEIDFRPGGVCAICMRSPDGHDSWMRGRYLEILAPEKLVFETGVVIADRPRFTAQTTVTFAVDGTGTLMTVRQVYDIHDPAFAAAVDGAPEGWRTTLDKLEREVARLQADSPPRSAVQGSFTLERRYPATPAAVFNALTDPVAKAKWFAGGGGYTVLERRLDVRPGGSERVQGRWSDGTVSTFDAVYFDVVPNQRLVYAYEMHLDDRKISVSLAVMQLEPDGGGTRLIVTEHGAFLDGYDDKGSREHGTGMLLDRLGAALAG